MYTTLIDPVTLMSYMHDPYWVVLDARFDLTAPAKGEALYREGHIPGARYVSLDADLSGPKIGTTGRHPLPDPSDGGGHLRAARHRRRHAGGGLRRRHRDVRGARCGGCCAGSAIRRWRCSTAAWRRGRAPAWPLSDDEEHWEPATFTPRVDATVRVGVGEVLPHVEQAGHVLVDARANDRFRGENETLDPVAGHIPGAVNRFFQLNLTAEKTFKSPEALRAEWAPIARRRRRVEGRDVLRLRRDRLPQPARPRARRPARRAAVRRARGASGARIRAGRWRPATEPSARAARPRRRRRPGPQNLKATPARIGTSSAITSSSP